MTKYYNLIIINLRFKNSIKENKICLCEQKKYIKNKHNLLSKNIITAFWTRCFLNQK